MGTVGPILSDQWPTQLAAFYLGPVKRVTKYCALTMCWHWLGAHKWSLIPFSEATALDSVRILQVCAWTGLT